MRSLARLCGFVLLVFPCVHAAAPTNLLLSNKVIYENDPDRSLVGQFTVVDSDPDDKFTFYLAFGQGDSDKDSFVVYLDKLLMSYAGGDADGPALDYEKQTTYHVRVGVRDSTNNYFEKSFAITMIDDDQEDDDGDGMNELAEEVLGLNDKKVDSDGDGFSDPLEIQLGSLPTDVNDWPDYPLVGWGQNSYGELMTPTAADFAKLATGQNHSLGLKFDGTIAAWAGWNEYGQITVPPGLSQVVEVAAGGDFWEDDSSHSLALKADGTVVGWGYDDEDSTHAPPPQLAGVVEISAGRAHDLALKSNGTVVAWGSNQFGQCDVPSDLQGAVAVSAGGFFSMALKSDGRVVTWGSVFNGTGWEGLSVPAGLRDVVAISAGRFHCLALRADGTVVAWGYNENQQTAVPPGLSGVVSIKAGGFHSLALKSNGSVVAWGENRRGQTAVPLAAMTDVVAISAGLQHSLAIRRATGFPRITSSAALSLSPGGELSHSIAVENATATQYLALGLPAGLTMNPVTGIISGTATGTARQTVRIVVDTNLGRLTQDLWINVFEGAPPTAVGLSPAVVMENSVPGVVVGALTASDPDAADTHIFELVVGSGAQDNWRFAIEGNQLVVREKIDRDYEDDSSAFSIRVRAMDSSLNGYEAVIAVALANDNQEDVDQDGLTEAMELLAGTSDFDYDTDNDGFGDGLEVRQGSLPLVKANVPSGQMVVAWGNNDRGQITVPAGMGELTQVAGGWAHSLALKVNGTVAAWGWNAKGQSTVPAGLTGVVAVDAGFEHSLALKSDGTVVAWGDNSKGQASVPANLSGVVAIAAGGYFNLALKADGTVTAWGENENGETTLPPGLNQVVAIAAGGFHGLALKNDGTVAAWGWTGATYIPSTAVEVVAISAGGIHSLALKRDGAVVSWGRGDEGQLAVPEMEDPVVELGTGVSHSMALHTYAETVSWGDETYGQVSAPSDAVSLRFLGVGANHNLSIRQATGFPAFAPRVTVRGWPGQTMSHQVAFSGATVSNYSAMGLPAGLTIHPQTGLITGMVSGAGARRSVRLMVETNKGRLSQVIWLNTADGRPPTDITLSGQPISLVERAPAGTVLGTVGAVDPDPGDVMTFDVEVISGSINPNCLTIVGGQLMVANSIGLDFENGLGGVLVVRVGATDLGHNYYSETLSIQLTDDRTEDGDGDGVSQAMEEDMFFSSDKAKDDYITLDKDGDGISALTEYAFNLNPRVADAGKYVGAPGSTVGLPAIQAFVDSQGRHRLRLEFLRRIGSGLTYVPQFSSDLKTWAQPAQAVQVTWTNGTLERCKIEDYQFTPSPVARFGRVMLQFVPPVPTDTSAPTAIGLASATLLENSPPGTVVGILSTVDSDPGDTHTYSVSVISGASPGSLTISGNQLVTAAGSAFDYDSGAVSLAIQVRSTDSTQKYHDQVFIISILDDRTEDRDGDGMDEATEEDFLFTSDSFPDNFTVADADLDGVPTLIEYAFNLDPRVQDAGLVLGALGSTSGFPYLHPVIDLQGHRRLRMEFLRRVGSGLTYKPLFSSTLAADSWTSAVADVEVVWSNGQWERCVVDDKEFTPGPDVRFGRVSVSK